MAENSPNNLKNNAKGEFNLFFIPPYNEFAKGHYDRYDLKGMLVMLSTVIRVILGILLILCIVQYVKNTNE